MRNEIEKARKRGIPSRIWRILRDMGRVSEAAKGAYQTEDLAGDIETLEAYEDYLVAPPRRSVGGLENGDSRDVTWRKASAYPELDALCEIMGLEASENPEVVGFRRDIIGGRLVLRSSVEEWIGEQSAKSTAPLFSVQTEEDREAMSDQVLRWRSSPPVPCVLPDWPGRSEAAPEDTLEYPIPGRTESPLDFRERSVLVPARGPLFLLKFVAAGLMEEYPWSEAQAVGFVLSGVVPRLPTASVTQYRLFPFRIVLDLDPGLNAKTVTSEYRRAQKALLNVGKRAKAQSEKHLRLAVFVAKNKTGTWRRCMQAWNSQTRPEWTYNDLRRFQRDASQARDALKRRRDRGKMPSPDRRIEHTYGLR